MRGSLVVLMLALVAVSGCAEETAPETSSDAQSPAAPEVPDEAPAPGVVSQGGPTAEGEPYLTATFQVDLIQGTVPFNATLTLDGTAFDGEGAPSDAIITWTIESTSLDYNASGVGLPAFEQFTVSKPGQHELVATLSTDGVAPVMLVQSINGTYAGLTAELSDFSTSVGAPVSPPLLTNGTGDISCLWDTSVGTWADEATCTPTVTFDEIGSFEVKAQVTDMLGGEVLATESIIATATVAVPEGTGAIGGNVYGYNQPPACVGVSNVLAPGTGGSPQYFAGDSLCVSARSVTGIECGTGGEFYVFNADGGVFAGPIPSEGGGTDTSACRINFPDWSIPADTPFGTYYFAVKVDQPEGADWIVIEPDSLGKHKKVEIAGSPV